MLKTLISTGNKSNNEGTFCLFLFLQANKPNRDKQNAAINETRLIFGGEERRVAAIMLAGFGSNFCEDDAAAEAEGGVRA
ncbi:hypothetical protein GWI33_015130 [Rhynchophorus ferrugineus]|uniref:Uncharacterized protein n=1 Tax=Rhynchophorus ferrugineus TaxID=354439 RepID=A0A834MBQ4_RHYFE|nr:hypothetical protein GWI33_015130 [Rhynchophorus ferrugineus]